MTTREVAAVFGAKQVGEGKWKGCCPAHDDANPSLDIHKGRGGRTLMICRSAGCEVKAICAAKGIEVTDLFETQASTQIRPVARPKETDVSVVRRIVATYSYRDESGELLYQVLRYEPRDFRQRRPGGSTGWLWELGDVRRVPYRLPALVGAGTDRPIFVVEGEKDVDNLMAVGALATTNAGGAGNSKVWAASGFAEPLRGQRIVVVPDNDRAGRDHAAAVVRALASIAAGLVVLELPGLAEKGDASDWLANGGTLSQLLKLAASAPAGAEWLAKRERESGNDVGSAGIVGEGPVWEEPVPLLPANLPVFPVEVLPPVMRDFAVAVAEEIQAPVDMIAMPMIAAIAVCVQGRFVVRGDGNYFEPLSLFAPIFAESGERKSAAIASVVAPMREWERAEIERRRSDIERRRASRAVKEKRLMRLQDKASRADDAVQTVNHADEIATLAAELAREPIPVYPQLFCDDITPERLAGIMAAQGERAAVISAEAGMFGMAAGRYNRQPNVDVYLKGHSGDHLRVDRQAGAPIVIDRPALTMVLMAQPGVLRRLDDIPEFRERGLLARMLPVLPASMVGHRRTDSIHPAPRPVMDAYRALIIRLLAGWSEVQESPVELALTRDAERARALLAGRIESRLRRGGDLRHIADWGSKVTGAAVRIAGLLHLAGCAAANDTMAGLISDETMGKAVVLAETYLIPHALAAFGEIGMDPEVVAAQQALDVIVAKSLARFSERDLHRLLKGRTAFQRVEAVKAAIAILESHHHVAAEPAAPRAQHRPPSPTYLVNPMSGRPGEQGQKGQKAPPASPAGCSVPSVPVSDGVVDSADWGEVP